MSLYWGVDLWSVPAIPVGEEDQVQLWKRGGNHITYTRTLNEPDRLITRVGR
jgi:hypothetical protein